MPHFHYPLFLHRGINSFMGASPPITVLDLTDELVFFARERAFKHGNIQVCKDRARKHEQYRMEPVGNLLQREQQFIQTATDNVIGGIKQESNLQKVNYKVTAQNGSVLYMMHIDGADAMRHAMRALRRGNVDRVPAVKFIDRSGNPTASLKPIDTKGGQRYELLNSDLKPANEVRLMLAAVQLMVWWYSDTSD
ncbi:MAG: hypothetical protein AAFV33_25460 [Chloroflexota bacterium]